MKNIHFEVGYEIKYAELSLDSISIYRELLQDKVILSLKKFLEFICEGKISIGSITNLYNEFFFVLAHKGYSSLEDYIIDEIIFNENPFSKGAENKSFNDCEDLIKSAAVNDMEKFRCIARLNCSSIKEKLLNYFENNGFKEIIEKLPEWKLGRSFREKNYPPHIRELKEKFYSSNNWSECIGDLEKFHENYGCGMFVRYRAFVWEHIDGKGCFKGIENPDPIELSDLIGYKTERSIIIENTIQFLKGFSANNVLIHGDRGTGKSSTVKAILNKYYTEGLRMVELPKVYLKDFSDIIRTLKNRTQKFIIFVDDLVFEDNEASYTALKSILEGGLENKSSNVLIYATSNRRHLVKEYFNERGVFPSPNFGEEIHGGDSVQEKLSLADRFGINVVFVSPDKIKYLEIVEGIAKKRNLKIDKETLHKEALKWERWYNGRSARTARQFVDWIEGHQVVEEHKS
ncbi:ATP-binding protein [Clostridium sp. WILCCON 0269]|uniref:ATP-binding protein n=1 Tax=Candidatus Clostridium eludens TaxID=3381663 RepID=A0ABW8SNF6_9CLOT